MAREPNDQLIDRDIHLSGVRMKRGDFNPGFSGVGPKNWTRKDETILEEACEALFRSVDVDASEIEVKVEGGLITLVGSVINREMKHDAEDAVLSIKGVKDVLNRLKIKR